MLPTDTNQPQQRGTLYGGWSLLPIWRMPGAAEGERGKNVAVRTSHSQRRSRWCWSRNWVRSRSIGDVWNSKLWRCCRYEHRRNHNNTHTRVSITTFLIVACRSVRQRVSRCFDASEQVRWNVHGCSTVRRPGDEAIQPAPRVPGPERPQPGSNPR